jgi:hypothetical protein
MEERERGMEEREREGGEREGEGRRRDTLLITQISHAQFLINKGDSAVKKQLI